MRYALVLLICFCPINAAHAEISANFSAGAIKIGAASDACAGATEGALRYNSALKGHESCNGTAWVGMVQVQTIPGPTAPAGSGYFVLTETSWNGNLGGLSGADAKCLTELTVTHTNWRGYATALANGQLVSSKVHASLCGTTTTCNNLMPLTNYYFAKANDPTAGGSFFTTMPSGNGPNDNASWAAANYFSGTYSYWSGRIGYSSYWDSSEPNVCTNWSTSSNAISGSTGISSSGDAQRFQDFTHPTCDQTRRLICYIDP